MYLAIHVDHNAGFYVLRGEIWFHNIFYDMCGGQEMDVMNHTHAAIVVVVVFETSLLFIQEQCVYACTCIPPKRARGAECPAPGVRRPHPGTRQNTMYSWATLFISLPQVPQQRESKEHCSRNSLTVVTARVFYVLSRFFYFHPQCQGRRHLRFYVICEPRCWVNPSSLDFLGNGNTYNAHGR